MNNLCIIIILTFTFVIFVYNYADYNDIENLTLVRGTKPMFSNATVGCAIACTKKNRKINAACFKHCIPISSFY